MPLNKPVTDWSARRCWIVGASSGIGEALARELARRGARVALSSRRVEVLNALAADMGSPGTLVRPLDVCDGAAFDAAAGSIASAWGGIDLVVLMAGDYKPMRAWDLDVGVARRMIETNLVGVYNALAAVVPRFLAQGSGHVAIVSSVAGYRGLPQALVYGPTKAALINLAEILHMDLAPKGIGVTVVNPGFVKTPLTAQNAFRMPALIEPSQAALEIVAGLERGVFEIHFPKRFTRVLKLLQLLPARLYFPLIRKATGL